MPRAAKKATFGIEPKILAEVQEAVAHGAAPSKNAFVERALIHELDEYRRQKRAARWKVAMNDPLFLRDIEETATAFRSADAESLRRLR